MKRLEGNSMHQAEAAQQLGISVRQVKRIWRAYREGGVEGLISKRRGKPSNNRLSEEVKQQALDLLYSRSLELPYPPPKRQDRIMSFSPHDGDISTLQN